MSNHTKKTKIVFLDAGTIPKGITRSKIDSEHIWQNYDLTLEAQIFERCHEAHIVVTNKVVFDKSVLTKLPKLQHIAVTATGVNCVDLDAAKKCNVSVSNVPNYASQTVAEHVFAMILSLRRNLAQYQIDIEDGQWQRQKQFCFFNSAIHDLKDSCLGIIGTGSIALNVSRIANAFGMRVLFCSLSNRPSLPNETLVSLDTLLKESDVLSVHCPLTEKSENLINTTALLKMKKTAVLINTARGSIVNLGDLYQALTSGIIAGAGIDVAPNEPPQDDDPILKLNSLHNCVVTPHTAWASEQAAQTLMDQVIANINAFLNGNPINLV